MTSPAWFISGSNRGIGLELVNQLSQRKDAIIFAGVRDPSNAKDLKALADKNPNIHIVKLVSASKEDAEAAAQLVERVAGGLDYVVANAGVGNDYATILQLTAENLNHHFTVNALGPLVLFQALYPLLKKRNTRRFVPISSVAGSIQSVPAFNMPITSYQTSKVALNLVTRKIAQEHESEGFVVFPLHPGSVETDMAKNFVDKVGDDIKKVLQFITPQVSANGILKVIDNSKPEDNSKFFSYDGAEIPW
eukprot:TRINITY_DN7165_c1_g1_i1.p1 TRINITY_DN7165_c1_g1~~TRINITY_DN7165_c1_g1_i1.p1  ORF type:complete len:249 (+),score=59.71 TRINITY_DN7165_c1_g1_i1:595-1341(+)